jgi:hypothetical protein
VVACDSVIADNYIARNTALIFWHRLTRIVTILTYRGAVLSPAVARGCDRRPPTASPPLGTGPCLDRQPP